ncbi:MAG TPA: TonB-dependent receptor [Steroidobacteraceae bacterium]|nr:TonB-dependent receptor [Steroidobacteraceae bacterium]
MPKHVVMVLTSHDQYGSTGAQSGSWLEELATPYLAFISAGLRVTLASPRGGQAPIDPVSAKPPSVTPAGRQFLADPAARAALAATRTLASLDAAEIDALFLVGGAATTWDFPHDPALRALVETLHARKAVLAAICHGVCGLALAQDPQGLPLVRGRHMTSISNLEDTLFGADKVVPVLPEDMLRRNRALYAAGPPFASNVVVDPPFFTGQNPASAAALAREVIDHLQRSSDPAAEFLATVNAQALGKSRSAGALVALAVAAALCATPQAVRAQSTAEAAAPESAGLEEVLVTARKREERMLEVPDSMTALGAATIESAHIENVKDVALHVPNVSIIEAQQPGVALLNIRGVGQARNGEPPVAVVVDGVQLSNAYQITQDLFDVERIEVLKGPQGAVYGRNAIGGAINITTRQPTDELEGTLLASYGSGSDFSASGAVSGPIVSEKLLFRAAGSYRSFEGDIDSLDTPGRGEANGQTDRNARLSLLARPSGRTAIDVRFSRLDTDSGAAWYAPVPPGGSIDTPRPFLGDYPSHAERTLTDTSVKADVTLDRVQLTSISAFAKVDSLIIEDLDFLPTDGIVANQALDTRNFSQELRLTSLGSGPFKWLAGAYYLNVHQKLDTEVKLGADFLPLFGLPSSLAPFLLSQTRATDDNDAYAVFGQASYRWSNGFELTGALRYDEDRRKELDRGALVPATYRHTFSALQPKASVSYFFSPDRMVYATIGKGFRSGGFNPQDRITRIYKAETNLNYEVGTKSALHDNRLSITAAAFFTKIDDRQVYTLDVVNSAQTLSNPIPKSRVHGVELDLAARPVAALDLGASFGYTGSKIERYDTRVFAGLPVSGDFTGNKLPQIPEFSYSLYAQYRLPLGSSSSLVPRVEWQGAAGDYFWEIDNRDRRGTQNFVNLRLTAHWDAWSVTGFLENALDEKYVIEFVPAEWSGAAVGDASAAARGRRWGMQARYHF